MRGMGAFAIYNEHAADSTTISNLFIDEYLRDANDAQIKVYLYLVRMMSAGLATSIGDIADRFNHTEKEVIRSLRYWERKGLLTLQSDASGALTGIYLKEPRPSAPAPEHQVISITPMLSSGAGTDSAAAAAAPAGEDVLSFAAPSPAPANSGKEASGRVTARQMEEFQKQESSRQLILIVEQYIGKPLSVSEVKTIYFISEQLHFSDELVDYLVEYCVGLGKKDFRYIEKVALNWAEAGISTAAQAQKSVLSGNRSGKGSSKTSARSFQSFEKTSYNFDELEKQLLNNG